MPELPEVETVRRSLESELTGRSIRAIRVTDFPGVLGPSTVEEAEARLVGRVIAGISRRGKYLIIDLDDETGVIVHLRMTGVLTLESRTAPPARFHRLTAELDDGRELRFADQRKFGRVLPAGRDEINALDARLGPEPLSRDFTPESLLALLRKRTAPIKSLLLDQHAIAGLGNIYVDEALFRARIHPRTSAAAVTSAEAESLHDAIVRVLLAGIEHRGTSFDSFRDAYGMRGENQHQLVVYGRGNRGLPCVDCGAPLERIIISGRGTSFCAACQPLRQTREE